MPEQVLIEIGQAGQVSIEVLGVKGPTCQDLTRELEKALGTVQGQELKEEFYEQSESEDAHLGQS